MFMDKMAEGITRMSVMDEDIDLFEGQYPVPQGVSYNSYLIEDEKLCLLDTVDARKQEEWLAGLDEKLAGRKLDYLVISHLEPDHAGTVGALCRRHPEMTLVSNAKAFAFLDQFAAEEPITLPRKVVAEGGTLELGAHTLHFVMAPMVHWPEVMVEYEENEKVLFSADGFGNFGGLTYTPISSANTAYRCRGFSKRRRRWISCPSVRCMVRSSAAKRLPARWNCTDIGQRGSRRKRACWLRLPASMGTRLKRRSIWRNASRSWAKRSN